MYIQNLSFRLVIYELSLKNYQFYSLKNRMLNEKKIFNNLKQKQLEKLKALLVV